MAKSMLTLDDIWNKKSKQFRPLSDYQRITKKKYNVISTKKRRLKLSHYNKLWVGLLGPRDRRELVKQNVLRHYKFRPKLFYFSRDTLINKRGIYKKIRNLFNQKHFVKENR